MVRKFVPFDPKVIADELRALDTRSYSDLTWAMHNFQQDTDKHYRVENYGDGLMMIAGGQGRCLFFFYEIVVDPRTNTELEILVAVLVYKKESQKAPKQVLERARDRMAKYKENHK